MLLSFLCLIHNVKYFKTKKPTQQNLVKFHCVGLLLNEPPGFYQAALFPSLPKIFGLKGRLTPTSFPACICYTFEGTHNVHPSE